jgi:hypothetical protein
LAAAREGTLDVFLRRAHIPSTSEYRHYLRESHSRAQAELDRLQKDPAAMPDAMVAIYVQTLTEETLLKWLDEAEASGAASPVSAVLRRFGAIYAPIRSAYHEAGHAVAATLMDLPLQTVTLRTSEGKAARTELAMTHEDIAALVERTPDGLARYLTYLLAGDLAEGLMARDEQDHSLGALEDIWWAVFAASRNLGSDQDKAEVKEVQDQCEARFREPAVRVAIDAVAQALLDRQTLTGAEVTAIVRAGGVTAKGDETAGSPCPEAARHEEKPGREPLNPHADVPTEGPPEIDEMDAR